MILIMQAVATLLINLTIRVYKGLLQTAALPWVINLYPRGNYTYLFVLSLYSLFGFL